MRNILSKLFSFIGKSLLDKSGKPSTTRILTLFVVVVLTLCLGVGFVFVCLWSPSHITEFVWAIAGVILGALGVKGWHGVKEGTTIDSKPEN